MLPLKVSMVNFCGIGLEEKHDPTTSSASLRRTVGRFAVKVSIFSSLVDRLITEDTPAGKISTTFSVLLSGSSTSIRRSRSCRSRPRCRQAPALYSEQVDNKRRKFFRDPFSPGTVRLTCNATRIVRSDFRSRPPPAPRQELRHRGVPGITIAKYRLAAMKAATVEPSVRHPTA